MKIAMIGHKRIPSREGGIEIVVGELSKRLTSLGHVLTVYNRNSRGVAKKSIENAKNEYNNIEIKWVPTPDSAKLNAIVYSVLAAIRAVKGKYDIIHFHAEGPAVMTALTKHCGVPSVVTIHALDWKRAKWGNFASKFLQFSEKTAVKNADEIIVLSHSAQNYFKEKYQRDTVYIPNGASRAKKAEANLIREKYGLSKDGYLLFVGRLVPEKRIDLLIDAYSKLQTDKPLVIAGRIDKTDRYTGRLMSAAAGKNIIFTDFVEGRELDELYSNAYLYVLPSEVEGMPLCLLEAMSHGCCCLTSSIPECTEVCEDRALSFRTSDEMDLREKLELLLSDKTLIEKYRNGVSDYITEKYDWDTTTEKTLEVYEEVLRRFKK